MNKLVICMLAAVLAAGAGCKRNENGSTEVMSSDEMVEATQQTTEKATAKTEAMTKQATEAVENFAVTAEDVMNDLNQSVEHVQQKVAAFDKTEMLAYADKYKDVIADVKNQVAQLTDQVQNLSITEAMGEKGKLLKAELSKYTGQLTGLKDRYGVYLEGLKAFGVDLSAYTL